MIDGKRYGQERDARQSMSDGRLVKASERGGRGGGCGGVDPGVFDSLL